MKIWSLICLSFCLLIPLTAAAEECLIENAVYQLSVPPLPNQTTVELTFKPMAVEKASTDLAASEFFPASTDLFVKLVISPTYDDGTSYDLILSGILIPTSGYPRDYVLFPNSEEALMRYDGTVFAEPNPLETDISSRILFFDYNDGQHLTRARGAAKGLPLFIGTRAPAAILMPTLGSQIFYHFFETGMTQIYLETDFFYLTECQYTDNTS